MATIDEIQFHYDVDNDFYTLFLDNEFRAYSCGVWDDASTLEDAQRSKIDRICHFARIASGARILDIGCGWGGLMERAITQHGASIAHGLTLSEDQWTHIRQNGSPHVSVALESWRDHRPEQPYDALTSVGAFEHFVSRTERLAERQIEIYRDFFTICRLVSTKKAWLGLQTIVTARNPATLQEAKDARYLLDKVFPGSALPAESDIHESSAGLYKVANICRIGKDYARTLACWRERLITKRHLASERFGTEVVDHFVRYFDAAERSFECGVTELVQISLSPVQNNETALTA